MSTRREALDQADKAYDEAMASYYKAIVQADEAFKKAKIQAQGVKEVAPPAEKAFDKSTALAWKVYEGFMAWKAYGEIMNPATKAHDEAVNAYEETRAQAEKLPE